MVRVRVNYVRDSFSVLLRAAHHYSMLMTFVSATTANNVEPNIEVHIINPVHVNKGNWESLVYNIIIAVWCATAYMTPKD